jgi:hypothetical protein
MTRLEFLELLRTATASSVAGARRLVENELPELVRYHVLLNQSFDGHADSEDRVFPEDEGREFLCLSEEEVADVLLRDGQCPAWIDIFVEAQSKNDTRVCLLSCGRFTEDKGRMYYSARGMGPFGVKSPALPPDFKDGTKFSLPVI